MRLQLGLQCSKILPFQRRSCSLGQSYTWTDYNHVRRAVGKASLHWRALGQTKTCRGLSSRLHLLTSIKIRPSTWSSSGWRKVLLLIALVLPRRHVSLHMAAAMPGSRYCMPIASVFSSLHDAVATAIEKQQQQRRRRPAILHFLS